MKTALNISKRVELRFINYRTDSEFASRAPRVRLYALKQKTRRKRRESLGESMLVDMLVLGGLQKACRDLNHTLRIILGRIIHRDCDSGAEALYSDFHIIKSRAAIRRRRA